MPASIPCRRGANDPALVRRARGRDLRRIARWAMAGSCWRIPAGPVANGEFAKLRGYVKDAGRDPSAVGLEVWVSTGEGGPDDWRKQFLAWKDAGVTHITVNSTYRRGSAQAHRRHEHDRSSGGDDAVSRGGRAISFDRLRRRPGTSHRARRDLPSH